LTHAQKWDKNGKGFLQVSTKGRTRPEGGCIEFVEGQTMSDVVEDTTHGGIVYGIWEGIRSAGCICRYHDCTYWGVIALLNMLDKRARIMRCLASLVSFVGGRHE